MTDETAQPSLARLTKLIMKSTASNDNEALLALRLAHREADKFGGWETILRGRITIIGDPFADIQAPSAARKAEYAPPPSTPQRPQDRPAASSPPQPSAPPRPKPPPVYSAPRRRRRYRTAQDKLDNILDRIVTGA
jgi:hypothetical protein